MAVHLKLPSKRAQAAHRHLSPITGLALAQHLVIPELGLHVVSGSRGKSTRAATHQNDFQPDYKQQQQHQHKQQKQ
jgi:hypothetical protein